MAGPSKSILTPGVQVKNKTKKPAPQTLYRQGDILIRRIEGIPTAAKAQPAANSLTIALGESTGHAHVLVAPAGSNIQAIAPYHDETDTLFFSLMTDAFLRHDEHATIELPPGEYQVVRQREYSPEEILTVAD